MCLTHICCRPGVDPVWKIHWKQEIKREAATGTRHVCQSNGRRSSAQTGVSHHISTLHYICAGRSSSVVDLHVLCNFVDNTTCEICVSARFKQHKEGTTRRVVAGQTKQGLLLDRGWDSSIRQVARQLLYQREMINRQGAASMSRSGQGSSAAITGPSCHATALAISM